MIDPYGVRDDTAPEKNVLNMFLFSKVGMEREAETIINGIW
jgi:hypothetical protein